jgi:hypothetical protein
MVGGDTETREADRMVFHRFSIDFYDVRWCRERNFEPNGKLFVSHIYRYSPPPNEKLQNTQQDDVTTAKWFFHHGRTV